MNLGRLWMTMSEGRGGFLPLTRRGIGFIVIVLIVGFLIGVGWLARRAPLLNAHDMPMPDAIPLEHVKLEIGVRLEEYKALRAEIVATLSSAYLTTNLTLTASGILIAGSPFIIQYHAVYLFLLASYSFYLIAWTQLRYEQAVFNMSEHISKIVAPGVRSALADIAPCMGATLVNLLSWEEAGRARNHPLASWAFPLETARYLFPICAAVASAVGFLVNASQISRSKWWETSSLWLGGASTIFLLIHTILLTFKVRSQLQGKS